MMILQRLFAILKNILYFKNISHCFDFLWISKKFKKICYFLYSIERDEKFLKNSKIFLKH